MAEKEAAIPVHAVISANRPRGKTPPRRAAVPDRGGGDALGEAVLRAVLEMDANEFPPDMRVWLAMIDALYGRTEASRNRRQNLARLATPAM